MTDNSEIQDALDNRDWTGAEVVTDRPRAKIVHSVRLPAEWSEALDAMTVAAANLVRAGS